MGWPPFVLHSTCITLFCQCVTSQLASLRCARSNFRGICVAKMATLTQHSREPAFARKRGRVLSTAECEEETWMDVWHATFTSQGSSGPPPPLRHMGWPPFVLHSTCITLFCQCVTSQLASLRCARSNFRGICVAKMATLTQHSREPAFARKRGRVLSTAECEEETYLYECYGIKVSCTCFLHMFFCGKACLTHRLIPSLGWDEHPGRWARAPRPMSCVSLSAGSTVPPMKLWIP